MDDTKRPNLLSALAGIRAAQETGDRGGTLVAQSNHLRPDQVKLLRNDARVNSKTREMLKELEQAQGKVATDPYHRRAFIREGIRLAHDQGTSNIHIFLSLLFAALDKKLPDGNDALPLFERVTAEQARAWEASFWVPRIKRDGGNFRVDGGAFIAPLDAEDSQTLKMLREIRAWGASNLIARLDGEVVASIQSYVHDVVYLIEGSRVVDGMTFDRDYEQLGSGVVRSRRGRYRYLTFEIKTTLILLLKETDEGGQIQAHLWRLKDNRDSFFSNAQNRLVIDANTVRELIPPEMNISKELFLDGDMGYCAVEYGEWRTRSGTTANVVMLFRRDDNGWRIIVANREGVIELCHGGKFEHFTSSKDDLPPHLAVLLRKGRQIWPADE